MQAPKPQPVKMYQVKEKLLQPALTSNFQVWIVCPNIPELRQIYGNGELISISCHQTDLPGSFLMTNDINNDRTGITEKFAYRKSYDNNVNFSFYVDHRETNGYRIIKFFETWNRYITNDNVNDISQNFHYRSKFPDGETGNEGYRTNVFIQKFERDFRGEILTYQLLKSYPYSIFSTQVSYERSELLKFNVSFYFDRHVINRKQHSIESEPQPPTANGTPSIPFPTEDVLKLGEVDSYIENRPILPGTRNIPFI